MRIFSPSLFGLRPRSAFMMPFSMSCSAFASNGWTTRRSACGALTLATWLRGVWEP
jgi:hypothetical protein